MIIDYMRKQQKNRFRNQYHISPQQAEQNAQLLRTVLLNQIKAVPVGKCPLEQLGLLYNKDNQVDLSQLRDILSKRLSYPSSEIGRLHMKANKLGSLDLKAEEGDTLNFNELKFQQVDDLVFQVEENVSLCPCCGFILQEDVLPVSTQIAKINHIGVSTYLYFLTMKHLIIFMFILFFLFSLYAIISNVISSNNYKKDVSSQLVDPKDQSYYSFLVISLGSKQINQTQDDRQSFTVQCWLGVVVVVVWGIGFGVVKRRERKHSAVIDIESKTASDYTVLVENYPKQLGLEELELQLERYRQRLKSIKNQAQTKIKIESINLVKPFYLDENNFNDKEIKRLNNEYKQYIDKFIEWIKQRLTEINFLTSKAERELCYDNFEKIKKEKLQVYNRLAQKIKKQIMKQDTQQTVPAFITFSSSYNKKFILYMHDDQSWLYQKLTSSVNSSNHFHFNSSSVSNTQGTLALIRQSPQPQDIIWTNMGQGSWQLAKKKLVTFTVTGVVLGVSFGAVYGLSKVQNDYVERSSGGVETSYISGLISLCISIINIVIQQVLRLLTKLQRNETYIHEQSSLGIKAVIALLINSILIPILVSYFFKQNLYGINGLAYDVFYLGITNSFLSPILKIFDLYYLYTRMMKLFWDRPQRKLQQNQNQLNVVWQRMQFEIGYEYIYIINLYLFTCFFCSLQPIIVLFALGGLLIMYWSQKYSLFNRCKRPTPGNNHINTTMYQLIYLGPIFYTLGSFCWSNFFKKDFIGIAPNLVAAVVSVIILLIPYKKLVEIFIQDEYQQQQLYEKNRIFLTSQYDRLNPATSSEGIRNYLNYLAQFKKNLEKKSPQQVKYVENQFMRQCGQATVRNQSIIPTLMNYVPFNWNSNYGDNQILLRNVLGINQTCGNPYLIGNTMVINTKNNQRNKNPLNMIVQNWNIPQSEQVTYARRQKKKNDNHGKQKNPFKMIQSHYYNHPSPGESQQVNFNSNTELQPLGEKNNGFNLLFNGIVNERDNTNSMMRNTWQDINISYGNKDTPLNVPLNIFTGLLNSRSPEQSAPNNGL